MQENVTREFVDKSVESVKETYGKAQAAAQETTKVMERTFSATTKSASDFNLHFLEITPGEYERGLRLCSSASAGQIAV